MHSSEKFTRNAAWIKSLPYALLKDIANFTILIWAIPSFSCHVVVFSYFYSVRIFDRGDIHITYTEINGTISKGNICPSGKI